MANEPLRDGVPPADYLTAMARGEAAFAVYIDARLPDLQALVEVETPAISGPLRTAHGLLAQAADIHREIARAFERAARAAIGAPPVNAATASVILDGTPASKARPS